MKDELVAIIDKPVAINRLIVTNGEASIERCSSAAGGAVDCDRLNPMNDVLQFEMQKEYVVTKELKEGE